MRGWPSSTKRCSRARRPLCLPRTSELWGDADGLGGHDLVGERVDHDAVLVDAGGVGEGVGSDDGLVGRGAEGDALGEHLAGGVELVHHDVVRVGQLVAARW